MGQEQTLQDIYTKIADIYDKFCNLGADENTVTWIVENITLSDTSYSATQLKLNNPDNKALISDAQVALNKLISNVLTIGLQERLTTDATYQASTGAIIPIPKGSPLVLLPKLLRALLLNPMFLKTLVTIVTDIILEILKEYLDRKLLEKNAEKGQIGTITTSRIFALPSLAKSLIFEFSNIPSFVGKRFDMDIDKSIIKTTTEKNPDLSKYLKNGLATVTFGFGLSGQTLAKSVSWGADIKLEYASQFIQIPNSGYANIDKYIYIYLNETMTLNISYLK